MQRVAPEVVDLRGEDDGDAAVDDRPREADAPPLAQGRRAELGGEEVVHIRRRLLDEAVAGAVAVVMVERLPHALAVAATRVEQVEVAREEERDRAPRVLVAAHGADAARRPRGVDAARDGGRAVQVRRLREVHRRRREHVAAEVVRHHDAVSHAAEARADVAAVVGRADPDVVAPAPPPPPRAAGLEVRHQVRVVVGQPLHVGRHLRHHEDVGGGGVGGDGVGVAQQRRDEDVRRREEALRVPVARPRAARREQRREVVHVDAQPRARLARRCALVREGAARPVVGRAAHARAAHAVATRPRAVAVAAVALQGLVVPQVDGRRKAHGGLDRLRLSLEVDAIPPPPKVLRLLARAAAAVLHGGVAAHHAHRLMEGLARVHSESTGAQALTDAGAGQGLACRAALDGASRPAACRHDVLAAATAGKAVVACASSIERVEATVGAPSRRVWCQRGVGGAPAKMLPEPSVCPMAVLLGAQHSHWIRVHLAAARQPGWPAAKSAEAEEH